ncbi:MAG: HepT-like ribonuclease domain-containing protein [Nitrospirota bacterium]
MTGKDRIILQKISTYIDDVAQYVDGFSFEKFKADKKTLSACAFSVSQVGELAKEISEETQKLYTDIPWKSIRGMRNKIVHDYENIDLAVLWGTVTKSLPELSRQIDSVLYQEIEELNVFSEEDEDLEMEP